MDSREALIRDLATSFGLSDGRASKYGGSRYDSATGTFYCDGITIPKHTVDKALEYYSRQMEYFRGRADQNTDAMDMFLISTVAFNAINLLKDNVRG